MFEQNSSGWMDMLQIFHAKSIVLLILSKLHWTSYLFRIWKGECFCCFHCSLLCHVPTFNSPLILSSCSMCWCNMRREILQHSSWEFIIMQGSLDVGNVVRLKTKINNNKKKTKNWAKPCDKHDCNNDLKTSHFNLLSSVFRVVLTIIWDYWVFRHNVPAAGKFGFYSYLQCQTGLIWFFTCSTFALQSFGAHASAKSWHCNFVRFPFPDIVFT